MYVIKNAYKNIIRSKGRSILVFIILMVITLSSCVALSIKNSADVTKQTAYDQMQVSAQINVDREGMMEKARQDPSEMQDMMSQLSNPLSIDQLETYASAASVEDFYYESSIGLNRLDETMLIYEVESQMSQNNGMPQGMDMMNSEITLSAYSSHDAMEPFISGDMSVIEGSMFDESTSALEVVISEEIALLNDYTIGDTFSLVNPNNENDMTTLSIVGIFSCPISDEYANTMFINYVALESIVAHSNDVAITIVEERLQLEMSSAYVLQPQATYTFTSVESFNNFEEEVIELGLDTEIYTVQSQDLESFEQSVLPLNNLSDFTMLFFIVILLVGALILIVFNMFVLRERKYEIGVLAAIGMRKSKVALQFVMEMVMITLVALVIGSGMGMAVSNPVANELLSSQVASIQEEQVSMQDNFGGNYGGSRQPGGGMMNATNSQNVDYVEEINLEMDVNVWLSLLGVSLLLSILSSSVAMLFILRYDPLKILSERA